MKPENKEIALERMSMLMDGAVSRARLDPVMAHRLASMARRISTRYKVRMPYEMRMLFCKKCKKFMVPGLDSRVRLGRSSIRAIRTTCNACGHTYRKIIPQ